MSWRACVSFEADAYVAARLARMGQLTDGGRLSLCQSALVLPAEHQAAREAVIKFLALCRANPSRAADELDAAISVWAAGVFPSASRDGERRLFPWHERKDCGHG
jgi:hypothetical protein